MTVSSAVQIGYRLANEVNEGNPANNCVNGHPIFYVEGQAGELPGHIYSEAGMREFRISRMCEWCFDDMCIEEDDDFDLSEGEGLLY